MKNKNNSYPHGKQLTTNDGKTKRENNATS